MGIVAVCYSNWQYSYRVMILKLLYVFGIFFLTKAEGKNISCENGVSYTRVKVNLGGSFTFSTSGSEYEAEMNCKARYYLGTCTTAAISCSQFDTSVATDNCARGDRLLVKKEGASDIERFCGQNGPSMAMTDHFLLQFLSDKKKDSKNGFKCKVTCTDTLDTYPRFFNGVFGFKSSSCCTPRCRFTRKSSNLVEKAPRGVSGSSNWNRNWDVPQQCIKAKKCCEDDYECSWDARRLYCYDFLGPCSYFWGCARQCYYYNRFRDSFKDSRDPR